MKNATMMCCRLVLLSAVLAIHILQAHSADPFCIDYDLNIEEQWPSFTQCLVNTETA